MKSDAILSARRPFVAVVAGKTLRIHRGDLFRADDPVATAHRDKFTAPEIRSTLPPQAEVQVHEVIQTGGSLLDRMRGPRGQFLSRPKPQD